MRVCMSDGEGDFVAGKMILEEQQLIILSLLSRVTVTVRRFDFNHNLTESRPGSGRLAESVRERQWRS